MFDISADWLKNAKISYRTLEIVDPVPFSRANRKIKSTQ